MTSPPPTTDTRRRCQRITKHNSSGSDNLSGLDKISGSIQTAHDFLREWRWWIAPAALALVFAVLFQDPFAGDWDSLDYTVLALQPEPSSMLLGRMLFIFTNHFIWRIAHAFFGLAPENAYLLFKYVVIAQSPLAVMACWTLARDLTNSVRAATLAALLLTFSPFYVIYSGQAMTEIPSILLLAVALTLHLRGLRRRSMWMVLAGASLLGAGVNLREGVALYGVWLALAPFVCGWRWSARDVLLTAASCALFFIFALGPFAYWYLMDVNGYAGKWHGWVESTKMESALHPVSLANFRMLLYWFFVASPLVLVTLPSAMWREWREEGWRSPLLLMATVGLFSNLALITHYSMVINGRYLLTGLPALIPLTGKFLLRSRIMQALASLLLPANVLRLAKQNRDDTQLSNEHDAERRERREDETTEARDVKQAHVFALALALICAVGLAMGWKAYDAAWPTIKSHAMTGEYIARLRLLPEDAVLMAGGQTVAVSFWRGVGAGRWGWIGTGGGWPGEARLVEVIENHLRNGERVFLDTDMRLWSVHGWQHEETRAVATLLAPRFRFRRVSETIYEIRPPDDPTARDTPDLQKLLPENR
jgi:hypothetical protein